MNDLDYITETCGTCGWASVSDDGGHFYCDHRCGDYSDEEVDYETPACMHWELTTEDGEV